MRVLIGCEVNGKIRDAFAARGHDAWSCDILPSRRPGNHYQCDLLEVIKLGWDLLICHPPCTHLAVSGARWFHEKPRRQRESLEFVLSLLNSPIPSICLENPISIISTYIREPHQIIQPYEFGHPCSKSTCLWLKNLPPLKPTNIVESLESFAHVKWRNADERSETFQGIADAMADQWGRKFKSGLGLDCPVVFTRPLPRIRKKKSNEQGTR